MLTQAVVTVSENVDRNSLEQAVVSIQLKKPGCWDGRFVNLQNEAYSEAKHGHNPFAQGFCICAPRGPSRHVPYGYR